MRLLIIGSLNGQIGAASRIAMQRGAKVIQADGITQAMEVMRSGQGADLVMCDVAYDIERLLAAMKAERIHLPVVACGVETDSRVAVAAIKAGAKEYVPLPPDAELIAAVLEAVAAEQDALIFQDPAMDRVMQMAKKVAASQAGVLITGESGTGKELVARYLHRNSPRKDKAFVAVNCAAIPGELLESELFGHEKGAFTGAVARRIGKFEEAIGGTLLLDEISEMDLKLQAKLLRAIQEREIVRIGSNATVKVDTRIVATSNRNMEETVKSGKFREDLYFRLNVVNCPFRPCAADRRTSRFWRVISRGPAPRKTVWHCGGCRRRPLPRSSLTTGRATYASSKTPCTARSYCPPGTKLAPMPLTSPRATASGEARPQAAPRSGGPSPTLNAISLSIH